MSCEDFTDNEGWDKQKSFLMQRLESRSNEIKIEELVDKARCQIFEAYELLKEAMKCLEKKP